MDLISFAIGRASAGSGGGITPTGTINITNTQLTDVTNYANAQVLDVDLNAENIKKDVNILGIVGTYTGSGVAPARGFVPTEWDSSGWITKGIMYGDIPNYYFAIYRSGSGSSATTGGLGKQLGNIEFVNTQIIGKYAFYQLRNLVNIVFAKGLKKVQSSACSSMPNLATVTFSGTPESVDNTTFSGCGLLTTINVPWDEGAVSGAPWGAPSATINYNYTGA